MRLKHPIDVQRAVDVKRSVNQRILEAQDVHRSCRFNTKTSIIVQITWVGRQS